MHNFRNGKLPITRDRYGVRKRGDGQLIYEAGSVLRGAITNAGRRWMAGGGLHIDDATYQNWAVANLDDDTDLTDRVLISAGFNKDGRWKIRRGVWPLGDAIDLAMVGNLLAGIVDTHRPL